MNNTNTATSCGINLHEPWRASRLFRSYPNFVLCDVPCTITDSLNNLRVSLRFHGRKFLVILLHGCREKQSIFLRKHFVFLVGWLPVEPLCRNETTKVSIVTDNPEQALDQIVETHQYIDSLVRMAYLGKITDEETLRSYVSSVFIEANRKGISIGKSEPKSESKAEEPAALDPKLWAEVTVPSGSHAGKKLGEIGKPALTKLYQFYLAKGFNTPFSKCVEQAAEDFHLDAPIVEEDEADEIPW